MQHQGDAISYANKVGYGARTGMGIGDTGYEGRTANWVTASTTRYPYVSMLKDLFGWENDVDTTKPGQHPSNRPNPFLNVGFGGVCLPAADDSDYPVFTRCCSDAALFVAKNIGNKKNPDYPQKMYCVDCPEGLTAPSGNGKDIYDCTCTGNLDEFGVCTP